MSKTISKGAIKAQKRIRRLTRLAMISGRRSPITINSLQTDSVFRKSIYSGPIDEFL